MIRVKDKSKHARCAYCHGSATGELCDCGGMHLECRKEMQKCMICGSEHVEIDMLECWYCKVQIPNTRGEKILDGDIVECGSLICSDKAICSDCKTIYSIRHKRRNSKGIAIEFKMNACLNCAKVRKERHAAYIRYEKQEEAKRIRARNFEVFMYFVVFALYAALVGIVIMNLFGVI